MLDRSAKQFFAVSLLMVGLLTLVNLSVSAEAMSAWSWIIALAALLGAGVFVVLLWQETRPAQKVRTTHLDAGTGSLQLPQSHAQVFEVKPALSISTGAAASAVHNGDEPLPFDTLGDESAAASPIATVEFAVAAPEVYAPSSEMVTEPVMDSSEIVAEQYAPSSEAISESAPSSAPVSDTIADADVDDLQEIEGIGPKYEEALYQAGIKKWAQLAQTSAEQLTEALQKGGYSRIPASIATWAEQAEYLVRGDRDGLKALQERLTGGRRTDGGDD